MDRQMYLLASGRVSCETRANAWRRLRGAFGDEEEEEVGELGSGGGEYDWEWEREREAAARMMAQRMSKGSGCVSGKSVRGWASVWAVSDSGWDWEDIV